MSGLRNPPPVLPQRTAASTIYRPAFAAQWRSSGMLQCWTYLPALQIDLAISTGSLDHNFSQTPDLMMIALAQDAIALFQFTERKGNELENFSTWCVDQVHSASLTGTGFHPTNQISVNFLRRYTAKRATLRFSLRQDLLRTGGKRPKGQLPCSFRSSRNGLK